MSHSIRIGRTSAIPRISLVAMVSLLAPVKSCAMGVPTASAVMTRASRCFAARAFSSALFSCSPSATDSQDILNEVEATLSNVFEAYGIEGRATFGTADILALPSHQRETVGIALNVKRRIDALGRSNDCRTCWLQRKHCICSQCPPCETLPKINRVFVLIHHKEVGMVVDTAKLLLSTFPTKSRLVVSGIGREHQPTMDEMLEAVRGSGSNNAPKCLVLFPSEDALTFDQIEAMEAKAKDAGSSESDHDRRYDVVVIDGTWAQARKMYNRYIPSEEDGGPQRVQLSDDAVATLNGDSSNGNDSAYWYDSEDNQRIAGHQLRRHPTKWREVATCEATRLLLRDMMADPFSKSSNNEATPWDALAAYQSIANSAACKQIGPPRIAEAQK